MKSEIPNRGPNQIPNTPFEFPPGHRIMIEKFVNNVKHHNKIKKATVQDMKPRKTNQRPKKRKVESSNATDSIVEIYMEDGPKNLIELIETYIEKLVLLHINEQAVFASGIITPFVSP